MILIGIAGIIFGLMVAPPQLIKIIRSGKTDGISLHTYVFLVCAMVCYLIHAVAIKDAVFVVAQSLNLITNSIILVYLVRGR